MEFGESILMSRRFWDGLRSYERPFRTDLNQIMDTGDVAFRLCEQLLKIDLPGRPRIFYGQPDPTE